jgi:hypothetical protein
LKHRNHTNSLTGCGAILELNKPISAASFDQSTRLLLLVCAQEKALLV